MDNIKNATIIFALTTAFLYLIFSVIVFFIGDSQNIVQLHNGNWTLKDEIFLLATTKLILSIATGSIVAIMVSKKTQSKKV